MPGIDYLRAMASGDVPAPPIASLMGFELAGVEEGRAVFEARPSTTTTRSAWSTAVWRPRCSTPSWGAPSTPRSPRVASYSTVEVKVNFVRPITTGTGVIVAEGSVVHRGSKVSTAEGRIYAKDSGKLLAHATTTCFIEAITQEQRRAA